VNIVIYACLLTTGKHLQTQTHKHIP